MKKLHRAAKMKRILCAFDYWFSGANLPNDAFLRGELRDHAGHVPLPTMASFPKLEHWGDDPGLILAALRSEAARRRYAVVFNREVVETAAENRRRREIRKTRLAQYIEALRSDSGGIRLEGGVVRGQEARGRVEEEEDSHSINDSSTESFDNESAEFPDGDGPSSMVYCPGQTEHKSDLVNDLTKILRQDDVIDQELPLPIVDDGSSDFAHALVRPKRVQMESYAATSILDEDGGSAVNDVPSGEEPLSGQDQREQSDDAALSKKAMRSLKRYSSNRDVCVIECAEQLISFCRMLRESTEKFEPNAAIGFDVEYCSLDEDIRGTLPAMLTLATIDPSGVVGLIWLDKYPNHGKDMIADPGCSDLISLLGNPRISKVGMSVTRDARRLASWWGIDDPEYVGHYFSGMVDLENMREGGLLGKSLQDMCALILGRNLPKIKERNARKRKRRRLRGEPLKTSHWRRGSLTKEMKRYAADDASCAIDVWNELRGSS